MAQCGKGSGKEKGKDSGKDLWHSAVRGEGRNEREKEGLAILAQRQSTNKELISSEGVSIIVGSVYLLLESIIIIIYVFLFMPNSDGGPVVERWRPLVLQVPLPHYFGRVPLLLVESSLPHPPGLYFGACDEG